MSKVSADLPRFAVIADALRRTTELLARELATPGPTKPDWKDFDWDVARAVAAMQGITVLLAHRLRWQGPPRWQAFLESQCRLGRQREVRIDSLIARLDAALHAAGVCAVGLKGTALRRLALYGAGERPMGDIDLLVRPQDAEKIKQVMRAIDYVPSFATRRHEIFTAARPATITECGEHPDNPLKIEVHQFIAERLPAWPVDITQGLMGGDLHPGLNDYPANHELLRHLLLHAAGNMRAHALRLLQLYDIALLAQRLTASDWELLLDTPDECGGVWWMWPVLSLTERYFQGCLPVDLDAFRARAPWRLRAAMSGTTLTEVSWSNLRIAAFPGLGWSRSALEALHFMRSRAVPQRVALDELQHVNTAMPALLREPWYGISHPRRIARWILSRPPRVQTMMSLRAARGDPGSSV